GATVAAYAIARDPGGVFVADLAVTWSVAPAIGTLAAGPATTTSLLATTVGTGRIAATRAAAQLAATTGELAVIAGAPAALEIDDAAGGTGQPIGDRANLTTDASGGLAAFAIARDAFGNFAGD